MANNAVVTSKYNAVTFMPWSLFEQFRCIANIYFSVISILMVIGTYRMSVYNITVGFSPSLYC